MTIPRRLLGAIALLMGLLSHGNALAADSLVRLELQSETVIDEGTTQMTLPILLSNNVGIAGFQCDIYLPVGFEVATTGSGDLAIALGRTTADRHQIATRIMSDGALRLVCTSAVNAVFTGNNGAVLSLTVAVGADVAVDNYTIVLKNIVLTDPDAERYAPDDASGTIVVKTPDPVTITANNLTMTYGDDVPELTYTAEGAELVGVPTLSCEATATSPVGTYPIVVGKGTVENRNVILVNGMLTIVPAPLTITAGTYTKKQGEAMPEFTLAYDGFKNGETSEVLTAQPVVSCEANEASAPGEYPVTVSGAEAQNYSISYTDGRLVVTEADAVIVTALSYSREYGDANPTFEYDVTGAALDGNPEIICEATPLSPVGTYPIVIRKGSVTNYNDSYVNGTLTITHAPLTVTATSYTIKQGEPLPEFALTYEGFKNGEDEHVLTEKPTAFCEATSASAPGTYPIVVQGGNAQNYALSHANGTLTIVDADAVVVTARSYSREYGDANPTFEYDVTGAALDGSPEIICEATPLSPVGTYPIIIRKGSVKNYNDSYVNGTLTITHATLTASVGDYSREQGEDNPVFTILYSGWKNGEDERVLTEKPTAFCEATAESEPGDYPITVSGGEAQNYTFDYINGTLTVTESSGIVELLTDEKECRVYTISGRRILKPQCGVNIIVTSDGSRVKVIRK